MNKKSLLNDPIKHIDIKTDAFKGVPEQVAAMEEMSFQARNLARGARIFDMMVRDPECTVLLTLAGSLISAGLKRVILDLIETNMVDGIVSTGANIVDQDFFEALGFKHYKGTPAADDSLLKEMNIDRIYDTYIDEDELRICDDTIARIAGSLEPKPYSSREFIIEMGKYLEENSEYAKFREESIVYRCFKKGVPIFVPAFSDCSAGFGLVHHQWNNEEHVSIDSAKDFLELTKLKINAGETGLLMIGGGVPKNFVQDIVVSAEILGEEVKMHKYAVQITVADERDGGLSGSTLREAHSWGKVESNYEQMIFSEATIAMPLIVAYAFHRQSFKGRAEKGFNGLFSEEFIVG